MSASLTNEQRAERVRKIASVVGLAVAGFLFAPFAIATIQGLVSLVVVATIGLLIVNIGVPWFSHTLANWKLKALKAVAAANPIETLENVYREKMEALDKIRENINQSFAVLQTLWSQIEEHNRNYPNTPSQYLEKYQKLNQLVQLRGKKYKQAKTNLEKFAEQIEEKRSDWKIALTMAEANKLANVGEDFQSKLLQDTALSTVQDGLNNAFAELETSLLDEQQATESASTKNTPTKVVVTSEPVQSQIAERSSGPTLDLDFDSDNVNESLNVPRKSHK